MDRQTFSEIATGDAALDAAAALTHQQIRLAVPMVMGTPMLKEANHDAVVAIAHVIAMNLRPNA